MVQKEPKRRGRPRAYDPDVALARAIESFWQAGYAATSLDDLSEATGMNRPSLYGAFGDKHDLYLSALAHYWELSRAAMREALAYDRPLREALQRVYRLALSSYLSGRTGPRGCFAISTATTEAVRDAKIRTSLARGLREIDEAFEARIRFAKDRGELRRGADPRRWQWWRRPCCTRSPCARGPALHALHCRRSSTRLWTSSAARHRRPLERRSVAAPVSCGRRGHGINVNTLHMSWSRQGGRSGPRGYHHGNLKEALIDAALKLIAQKGPAGFTFAEAARWAGVSPAAPYRHFRDRDDLMADVAQRGFDQFEAVLARAWDGGRPDAFAAFDRVGKAYLQFARSEPAYYSAMFEAGIPPEASAELREAGERAF